MRYIVITSSLFIHDERLRGIRNIHVPGRVSAGRLTSTLIFFPLRRLALSLQFAKIVPFVIVIINMFVEHYILFQTFETIFIFLNNLLEYFLRFLSFLRF